MTLLKQAMAILGTVLTIAIIMAIVSPKTAQAVAAAFVQIQPGTTTHVGQNESQLVSLVCEGNYYCVSMAPDGTLSSTAYAVPAGYTLIVTDWEFFYGGQGVQPGQLVEDILSIPVKNFPVFAEGFAVADVNGHFGHHEKFTVGVRFASGTTPLDGLAPNGAAAYLQGYLVPN